MKPLFVFSALLGLAAMSASPPSAGQSADRPKYQDPRFEENWSSFQTPADSSGDRYDRIKNIEITDKLSVSAGGHARVRLEDWTNFGFGHPNDDTFILYRAYLHTDWRYGEHLRVFLEGRFATLTERDLPGGSREALDIDDPDFWNTFAELRLNAGELALMGRAGRQELQFGRQRLISPLEWTNNRRIFDGVRAGLYAPDGRWTLDAFWTRPVKVDSDDLNESDNDQEFAGAYYTLKEAGPVSLDAYFLYLESEPAGQDVYTAGGRVFGATETGFAFDGEAAFQFGDSGSADIAAWMVAAEITYTFTERAWKPSIGAGFDYASGDDDPLDDDVGTFNQLFPLGHAYFGYIDTVGRQNIVDVHASIGATIPTSKPIKLAADLHRFWLAEEDDALYNAGGGVVRPGGVNETDVGVELDLTGSMNLTRHASFSAGFCSFFPGDFIDDTGADAPIHFLYSQVKYVF